MRQLDKFSIDHDNYQGARMHNDLNKLVEQSNVNFRDHSASLFDAHTIIGKQAIQIADLTKRLVALETAK
jgi:hypothetical protein